MATEKKQSFLGGAAVLAFGIMAVKVIGAVFKIPLRNILGEGGSADFSNAYNIYATMLTISTAGLPVALSKLVSEAYARGRTRQAQRTFRLSLIVFLVLGLLSFALMWWGNDYLASLLNNPRAAYGIRTLAPAVVCVGCLSAFRGYAQGRQYMTPTAVSQIIEALCKLVLGLALSMWLLHIGQPDYIAAAGAIAGVTAGTILSLVYMAVNYLRHRPAVQSGERCATGRAIVRRLLALAIPINLRGWFPSETLRNFITTVRPYIDPALGDYTFPEIVSQVRHFMKLHINRQELQAAFTGNVRFTKNFALRLVPVALKNPVMALNYRLHGVRPYSCTYTNPGAFTVPPEMAEHIRGAEVILGQATVPRCHCASISYGDTMEITFAGTQAETDTERDFFRFLVRAGIPVRVESNR